MSGPMPREPAAPSKAERALMAATPDAVGLLRENGEQTNAILHVAG